MVADVGNSAIKLAASSFRPMQIVRLVASTCNSTGLPTVVSAKDIRSLDASGHPPVRLEAVLMQLPAMPLRWFAASVNRTIEAQFSAWVRIHRPQDDYLLLGHGDFPLQIDVRAPDRVGTDRLAAAVAANEMRAPSAVRLWWTRGRP